VQRMRESSHPVQIGAKRKRVASNNENAHTNGRSTRTKRMKINGLAQRYSSGTTDESGSEESEMEVDLPTASWSDDESELAEEDEEDDSSGEESDELDESGWYGIFLLS
jgi:hypothetical protein